MGVFQITKEKKGKTAYYQVLVINDYGDETKQYIDTLENFKQDSGGVDLGKIETVIYNDAHDDCVVNDKFLPYPNSTFEGYINDIDKYIAAKEKREYVPPAEPTFEEMKESKLAEAKRVFGEKRDAIRFIQVDDTNTYGFDCASEDITNFLAAYTALTNNVAKSGANTTMYKVWLNETDKGVVELNLEQMNKVFDIVRNSQFEAYAWLSKVEAQIEAATSKADLEAIVL